MQLTSAQIRDTMNQQLDVKLIQEIRHTPIANLFSQVLHLKRSVQNRIDQKKNEIQQLKKCRPYWRVTKILYVLTGCVNLILKLNALEIHSLAKELFSTAIFAIGYCAFEHLEQNKEYEIKYLKYEREELKLTMGRIEEMLTILKHFDNPTQDNQKLSKQFRSLKFWHLCQEDSTPKFEDFFSVLQNYLPKNDEIRSLVWKVAMTELDRSVAWRAIENKMDTLVRYIKIEEVSYSRPC